MKKILFMSVMAALLAVGCSENETAPEGVYPDNNEKGTYYMTVNLTDATGTETRATDGYEDGTVTENKVERVRFYFFNGAGAAVNVKPQGNTYVNYYDWTPKTGDEPDQSQGTNDGDDVESTLNATIVINTKIGDKIPQRIAALVNPRTELLGASSLSMTNLRQVVADYAAAEYTTEGKFVMFNSVYESNGIEIGSAHITEKNLCEDPAVALLNPVTLYVERCVAKVRVTLDSSIGFDNNNRLALKDKNGQPIKVENQQVYLKLNNWDLTAETSNGRLVKRINTAWEGNWWNKQYRSCWAINSMSATNQYSNYTSIATPFTSELYTNENAQQNDINGTVGQAPGNTKVILKGTLCKEDGTSFTIASHLGVYMADDANMSKLKESFLTQLAVNGKRYFYETNTEGVVGREQIGVNDIQIVVAPQLTQENSKQNCYVYPQLTTDAAKKTWYNSMNKDAQAIADAATTINADIANTDLVHRAMVWNSGMTYYYYEIQHPTTPNNYEPGVVRNHIYATNVKSIAGLGTPVYDPEKVIYPEIPDPVNHYIAAEIKILSWHVVNTDYNIAW